MRALESAAGHRRGPAHRRNAGRFPGITAIAGPVDILGLIDGKDALVGQLRAEKYTGLAVAYDWEIMHGAATFTDGPAPIVDRQGVGTVRIEAGQCLVAAGAAPWAPPVDGLAGAGCLTSTTAMESAELPESMIVVGGNAVGLELAQLFARLGTTVTIVEALDRLAPFEEPEISAAVAAVFADAGITVHTGAALTAVRRDEIGYTATVDGRTVVRAQQSPAADRVEPGCGRGQDRAARGDRRGRPPAQQRRPDLGRRGCHRAPAVRVRRRRARIAMADATDSHPRVDPDRASFSIALHAARDQLILAAGVIADTTISLIGAIGRLVPANLMPDRPVPTSPRVVKRAISKYNPKGTIDRVTYKATISIDILTSPDP